MRRLALVVVVLGACGSPAATSHDAGNETGGPPTTPTCADYCAVIQAACTTSHLQYSDTDFCMASCLAFPVGTSADRTGDTLGCRVYYARQAAMSADLGTQHCTHAGPGGDGICGDNCSGFCDIAMMYCSAANNAKVYDTRDECLKDCGTHLTDMKLDAGDGPRTDSGNEVACQLYHVQMGSVAPDEHCLGDLALTALTCR